MPKNSKTVKAKIERKSCRGGYWLMSDCLGESGARNHSPPDMRYETGGLRVVCKLTIPK